MAQDSHGGCPHCDSFLQAALEASRTYHELLGALERAHIRNETEATYHLQAQIAQALLSRDKAITALLDHQRTHVKSARHVVSHNMPTIKTGHDQNRTLDIRVALGICSE